MKRFFCVLCLVIVMLIGGISVFSAPYPEPGDETSVSTEIVLHEISEE